MFDTLSQKLQDAFRAIRTRGRLTEDDVRDAMRTVRIALLEADVALEVVKDLVARVRAKAVGEQVLGGIRAGDQVVKIVQDELVSLLGESDTAIPYRAEGPTVILMAGLQGSGKTTTCGKLARLLAKRDGRKPLLVAADLQRPAAVDQLQTIGRQLGYPVYAEKGQADPVALCQRALAHAAKEKADLVILDTAGRLHVDEELMRQLKRVHEVTKPDQTLLVCDAMTGQDAVRSAKAFHEALPLSGAILTKLDGDTRGGAALSFRHVTGRPVKFAGLGEQMDRLEEFHPQRMASRILGMGDIVSLVEKAQAAISADQALEMQEKLLGNRFTLEDFLSQLQAVKKMGNLKELMAMIPGLGKQMEGMDLDESELAHIEAMIRSMTPAERRDPDLLDGSRRRRIARGAGTDVQALNQFLGQYKEMQKMVAAMSKGKGLFAGMRNMLGMGRGAPPGMEAAMANAGQGLAAAAPLSKEDRLRLKKERREKKARRKRSRGG